MQESGQPDSRDHGARRMNWAGNVAFSASGFHRPSSVSELQRLVASGRQVRALGTGHSFNTLADTAGDLVCLAGLPRLIEVDTANASVTVGAGLTYGELAAELNEAGRALHNLASLPHVSVAGACATGTHGSGNRNGNLSTAVAALEMVTAGGNLVTLSRAHDTEWFQGAVVSLGALGVVTKVTLDLLPTFMVSQVVYENLALGQLESHLEEIFSSGYSVSLFTDWQNHRATQVWIKRRVEPGAPPHFDPEFFGAKLATRNLHPLAGHSAENCTEQMGVPGPWYERLPHFKMNFTPSSGAELQSEYFVPLDKGYAAILAVEELRDQITPHLFITELRTVAADDLWTSPCYQRPSMTIHFTWKPEWSAVKKVLPLIEEKLAPFGAKPHWAKLFTMQPARLRSGYARMSDYKGLLAQYDPK